MVWLAMGILRSVEKMIPCPHFFLMSGCRLWGDPGLGRYQRWCYEKVARSIHVMSLSNTILLHQADHTTPSNGAGEFGPIIFFLLFKRRCVLVCQLQMKDENRHRVVKSIRAGRSWRQDGLCVRRKIFMDVDVGSSNDDVHLQTRRSFAVEKMIPCPHFFSKSGCRLWGDRGLARCQRWCCEKVAPSIQVKSARWIVAFNCVNPKSFFRWHSRTMSRSFAFSKCVYSRSWSPSHSI